MSHSFKFTLSFRRRSETKVSIEQRVMSAITPFHKSPSVLLDQHWRVSRPNKWSSLDRFGQAQAAPYLRVDHRSRRRGLGASVAELGRDRLLLHTHVAIHRLRQL
jgi:hypothetical protein